MVEDVVEDVDVGVNVGAGACVSAQRRRCSMKLLKSDIVGSESFSKRSLSQSSLSLPSKQVRM